MKRGRGQWCWACQTTKPNEAFSGGNHGRQLCRACASARRREARAARNAALAHGAAGPAPLDDTASPGTSVTVRQASHRDSALDRATTALPTRWPGTSFDTDCDPKMTERAREVLADALALSDDERRDLAEQLASSLPADPEWLAELERRARRALTDPADGEAWEEVQQRLEARIARR
jgi:hypothetical protein